MMRVRGDVNQKALAELYYQYLNVEEDFVKALFVENGTPLGRIFVQEAALPQDGKLDVFSDASALSDWAVEGMIWAAGAGLFGGFEDGTLRPQETATRAQAAKVFCVLLDPAGGRRRVP